MSEPKRRTFRVMDTPTLKKVNDHAVKLDQNRYLVNEFFDNVDPSGTHVIGFHMDHVNFYGTEGIRCNVHCKMKGSSKPVSVWIDVTHEEFSSFQTVTTEQIDEDIKVLGKVK